MCRWSYANAAEVETVGIPAGLQGGVGVRESISMQTTRFEKLLETIIVEMNQSPAK
jgi:hypothetical protein